MKIGVKSCAPEG